MTNQANGAGSGSERALRLATRALSILLLLVGLVAILDLPLYVAGVSLFPQQYLAAFWGIVTCLTFLYRPLRSQVRWFDVVPALLALLLGGYVALFYGDIIYTLGLLTPFRAVTGALAVILTLEGTRRLTGWPLVIIILAFILYARFGALFPGPLRTSGVAWDRLAHQLFLGTDFLFGTPLRTVVLVVFAFIIFGQLLFSTGGGDAFIKLAHALMGRYRGGPAKASIVASSFFGTISGSAVANVMSTGLITIPLMRRTGYHPVFAAAVEATASTGGVILPPVMGAAAFVMAEFLGVAYSTVAIAALVPALAYYLALYLQVDLRAARLHLKGIPPEDLPPLRPIVMEVLPYLVPIVLLVYLLFGLYVPVTVAALYAAVAIIVLAILRPEIRAALTRQKIGQMCEEAARSMLEITMISAAAGFVVGLVAYTGLGLSLSQTLTGLASGNLLVLALLTALASTILGMGMPVTATYILLAVLMAPALVRVGVEPIIAHLFVLYFGVFSFLTPPVALAAYAAASIAGASAMQTGWQAMRLALTAYVVPFIMLYKPGMALRGSTGEMVGAVFDTILAVAFMAVALEGFWRKPLPRWQRIVLFAAGIAMFAPGWSSRILGLALGLPVLVLHRRSVQSLEGTPAGPRPAVSP